MTVRRNINNFRYSHATTLTAEGEKDPKSIFMRVKEESETAESLPPSATILLLLFLVSM